MSFYIVHVLWGNVGVLVGVGQNFHLGVRIGGGNAVGAAVLVHGGALNDSVDMVPVGFCILEALQQDQSGAIGAGNTVGVIGEGFNIAVGGEHCLQVCEG